MLFQVVARDDDQNANGQLSYMLSGGNDEGTFSLSSSGQLSLTQTLDREAQGKFILLVTATDSGMTAADRKLQALTAGVFVMNSVVSADEDLHTRLQCLTWIFLNQRKEKNIPINQHQSEQTVF